MTLFDTSYIISGLFMYSNNVSVFLRFQDIISFTVHVIVSKCLSFDTTIKIIGLK